MTDWMPRPRVLFGRNIWIADEIVVALVRLPKKAPDCRAEEKVIKFNNL